jgi:cytochrome c biogenesis protein CcdA
MNLLASGSVLAAFFAGAVALFAPCCIVFLAPSYMAAAVANRRWRLLPLTFVFAGGLAMVLVPITLGFSLLAATVAKYHAVLYYAGGIIMLLLAAYSLSGRMWHLPAFLRAPDTRDGRASAFFALGVFSGIASSCCAPVLAGVMTLSAVSASPVGGILLGLAFVLGMTLPLFLMALAHDRLKLGRRWTLARPVKLRIARKTLHTNTINIAVAAAFAIMGGFVIYLASAATMTRGPGFQVAIGDWLARIFARVQAWTAPVPQAITGLAVLSVAGLFVYATIVDHRRSRAAFPDPHHDPDRACSHEPEEPT